MLAKGNLEVRIREEIVDKRWGNLTTRWDMRLKIGGLGWTRVPIFLSRSMRGGIGLYTAWCGIRDVS